MTRIALYSRVSKSDGSQTTDNQLPEMRALAASRGEVVATYLDEASAVKHRPEFERMLAAARKKEFDVLVIWAIDRFGRSMFKNMTDIMELDRLGISALSVRETWLDTTSPVRPLLIAIMSWVAEQERNRLSERTRAGLARVKREGRRLGRPQRRVDVAQVQSLTETLGSVRKAARVLNIPLATVQRALKRRTG